MAKRHISPLTLREIWDKLERIDNDNRKTKGITLVALAFAVWAVTIPLMFDLFPPSDSWKQFIIAVYAIVGASIFLMAYTLKIRKD
ncbi:MAG: hypothetical protein JSW06_01645 [Thermoplasmatales archaeon]|nr:MAG: hypothetical protein JSW06_01645 [Thermoplasmatales archaeon]